MTCLRCEGFLVREYLSILRKDPYPAFMGHGA
jgi:hypothetical protein